VLPSVEIALRATDPVHSEADSIAASWGATRAATELLRGWRIVGVASAGAAAGTNAMRVVINIAREV
jgi:uncharacterized protein YmfQ (DUF2313 family)